MTDTQQGIIWLIAHIVLGVLGALFPIIVAVWLACIVGGALLMSITDRNKAAMLHLAASYLCSYEVLVRMTKSPLPWETGRYVGIPLLVIGLALGKGKRWSTLLPGLVLLACISPSLLRVDYNRDIRDTLVFNWFGALTLALSVMYFNKRVLLDNNVVWILRCIAGPAISVAMVGAMTSPNLESVGFILEANVETTGFGSNQVATVFGMGIVSLSLAFCMNRSLFGPPWIDFTVAVYLFFRALISFSRGGLFSAMIAIAAALAVIIWAGFRYQNIGQATNIKRLLLIPLVVLVLGVIFFATDQVTGGLLSLRYRGETSGTLSGDRELTLSVATSGRSEIVRTDLEIWLDHLLLGVGPGNSARLRPDYGYRAVAPHTEYSRLLSEHGMLGLLFCAIIIVVPFWIALNPKYPVVGRAVQLALALFSLTVMAHSATRLFGTTYLYGISWAIIVPKDMLIRIAVDHPVLRKRLSNLTGHYHTE